MPTKAELMQTRCLRTSRDKAQEIIARIETILNVGDGATNLDSAKVDDIRNLIGRYRRGEA
jgi:hypothetical protein